MQQNQNQQEESLELEHMIGYSGQNFKTMFFNPQNANQFVYAIGGCVVIEDIQNKHDQKFLRGHDMPVTALAISQNGRYLLSGQQGSIYLKTPDAQVILWDLQTLQKVYSFPGIKVGVSNLSFSPDDRMIAITGMNNVFCIWNLDDFTVVIQKVFENPVNQICWDAIQMKGKYKSYSIVTSLGTQIQYNKLDFDLAGMQYQISTQLFQLPGSGLQRQYTNCVIQGDYLYIGSASGEVVIFNIPNRVFKALIPISSQGVTQIVSHFNYLFVGTGEGVLKMLEGSASNYALLTDLVLQGSIMSLSLSADQKELIVGTSLGKIYRVLIATFDATLIQDGHTSSINDICVQTDSHDIFATIDNQGLIHVWDTEEMNIMTTCVPPSGLQKMSKIQGTRVQFTDDDGVVSGWNDGFIRCFEITRQKQSQLRWEIVNAHNGPVTAIYCDINYILSGGQDSVVRIWSRKVRQLVKQLSIHTKQITRIFPDIDKPHIIHSCSVDKTVHSYDLKAQKKQIFHQAKNGQILDMTQRKDSEKELITCGQNIPIQFWDCDVIDPVDQIEFPYKLECLEVSPSGQYLALGSESGEVVIFDIKNNQYKGKYLGHSGKINQLKWTFDQRQILTVSQDGSICLWNFFE